MATHRFAYHGFVGDNLSIDTRSGRVTGEWEPTERASARLDFPTPAELCRCCGAELLASGSRWSVWFCKPCKDRVRELNKQAGGCVVPIGRHSLMNGVSIRGDRQPDSAEIEEFVAATQDLFGREDRLDGWADEIVRRNCATVGLTGRASVPLGVYLDAVTGLSREAAFRDMLEYWAEEVAS